MVDPIVLDDIPVRFEVSRLLERLQVEVDSSDAEAVARLAAAAEQIARPKAACGTAFIESRDDDAVVIDGIRFRSRVLRVNTDQAHRVMPFLATCGQELETWAAGLDDMLERYWADAIMHAALYAARTALNEAMARQMPSEHAAVMNPGSLADWPIQQQRPLFQLLGDAPARIGVRLTDSLLMLPGKTVSGIRFPTETRFENCQLCPRPDCPGRRAPYDRQLYAQRYAAG